MALTTDSSDANHWQDARTTNADSITFGFYNRFKAIVGSSNITDRLLSYLANEIKAVAEFFKSEATSPNLGAQLIECDIVSGPSQDELLKDQVNVDLDLQLPYELDKLRIKMAIR